MTINGKVQAGISWAVIFSALGLAATGLYSANAVENFALANTKDIAHEREMRIANQESLKEDLDELKDDLDDIKLEQKEANKDIKDLLNQLLLKQPIGVTK